VNPQPEPPAPASWLAAAPAADALSQQVTAKLQAVRCADYFAILELDPAGPVTDGAVTAHYDRLRRAFDPVRYEGRLPAAVGEGLHEIQVVLAEAHEVLSDPVLRERYRHAVLAD